MLLDSAKIIVEILLFDVHRIMMLVVTATFLHESLHAS